MESDNLKTASLYINNQLLSRGLLRNGQSIEFARPDRGEGGIEGTTGRVMSVINDLILRRDRDAEQRENLSQTIRALGADALRQTTELKSLNSKYTEAQRIVNIAEAAERALKTQLKSAEQAGRGLKEEMGRMRILVGQTRAQCANEVRKRERVIEGMKKHVGEGSRARGSGKAVGVAVINVTPGVGAEVSNNGASTDDTGYDLRSETNEFLTELAKGLSEENESLRGLVRRTVDTLRKLSGCDKEKVEGEEGNGMVVQMDTGYEVLSEEMDVVIEHLRNLLTNPSFVPLEEVEVREEEIMRLREGWEKMEARWKEAVYMMEGWRKRMASSGQTVNLEELRMGLMLSPLKPNEQDNAKALELSMVMEGDEGDTQADIDAMDDSGIPAPERDMVDDEDLSYSDESLLDEDEEEEAMEGVSAEVSEEQAQDATMNTVSSASPGPPPQLSPLKETTKGNRGSPGESQGKAFTTILEENTWELLQLDNSSPSKSKTRPPSPQKRETTPQTQTQAKRNEPPISPSDEISLLNQPPAPPRSRSRSRSPSPKKSSSYSRSNPQSISTTSNGSLNPASTPKLQAPTNSSRLPRPRNEAPLPQQSPLTLATIAAKLAATEREADAARVRAKIKAAKMGRAASAGKGREVQAGEGVRYASSFYSNKREEGS